MPGKSLSGQRLTGHYSLLLVLVDGLTALALVAVVMVSHARLGVLGSFEWHDAAASWAQDDEFELDVLVRSDPVLYFHVSSHDTHCDLVGEYVPADWARKSHVVVVSHLLGHCSVALRQLETYLDGLVRALEFPFFPPIVSFMHACTKQLNY